MNTKQKGSTLIVVLVLLTIMTFMGMALYRSSDLASLISGNISSKQIATQVGDYGLAQVESVMRAGIPTAAEAGYVPVQKNTDANGIPIGVDDAEWSSATSKFGFSYQYLIEKLCDNTGQCTTTSIPQPSSGPGSGGVYQIVQMYRVTVKITGPKNLESYIQALYSK